MVTLYSAGKILAEDIVSEIKVPPLDNSQMDGYAVRCADFAGGRRNFRFLSEFLPATSAPNLNPALSLASLPAPDSSGCRCSDSSGRSFRDGRRQRGIPLRAQGRCWIRRAGCDIDIGQTVLKRGDRLTPPALGVAASVGVSTVKVYRPIRVSLFFTGDELAMPGEKLVEGGIYNSNRFVLRGLLHQLGCDVVDYGNIPDTFEATLEAFRKPPASPISF